MGIFDLENTEKYPSRGPKPDDEKEEEEDDDSWGEAMTISNKEEEEYWEGVVEKCFEGEELTREGVAEASDYCAISFPDVVERLDTLGVIEIDEEDVHDLFNTEDSRWKLTRFHEASEEEPDTFLADVSTEREQNGLKGLVNQKKND